MAILKCKMCGGELNLEDGMTVAECEYCGSQQTLPKLVSDNIANLYDRANHFRRNNDFDKAEGIYERILAETPEDSEAYWSLVLCRYGIEYVEDPTSGKRVPTVNRAQYTSIFDDENYKSAIEHSDAVQRRVYEEEAAAINEIQKGILAISQKEEPFDVFICYKETDQNGRRTRDSVIANDLYHQLIKEGFKVFFSRITLEDKLGTAYEPYIFAALNSSKVMVVLGTKPEHFNAVWVKNEWSRYLALVKQSGGEKVLIPAYRDMDPYDLPEEFSHLQAQDMSKLGFMQDLIRGIKKITGADNKPKVQPQVQTVAVNTVSTGAADISPLLKRMFMYLEDGEWNKADEYAERVLDKDPENAEAYLGKLMADLKVRRRERFKWQDRPFDGNRNYQKAVRFGSDKLKTELNGYIKHINDSIAEEKRRREEERRKREEERRRQEEEQRKQEEERRKQEEERRDKDKKRLSPIREQISKYRNLISAGCGYTFGLKEDGTVVATETNPFYLRGEANVSGWTDSVAVSAGGTHTVGLKTDGTVIATEYTGDQEFNKGQCDVTNWTDIVAVSAGYYHTVGLKSDGTVVAVGSNGYGQCDVTDWTDIVAVSAGDYHTVGLKSDRTVVATGEISSGKCDVSGWTDIVAISAGNHHTVGLKADGTVVATKYTGYQDCYYGQCDVEKWKDIVAVSAGDNHTVGLKSDRTVVATGFNSNGRCDVSDWKDIVAISAGGTYTVGLKADGTVVATYHPYCNVRGWKLFKSEKEKEAEYNNACTLQVTGTWDGINRALALFNGLGNYKDSFARAKRCYGSLLSEEKASLQKELANLKGIFSGKRRKQIEARLAEIELELKKL